MNFLFSALLISLLLLPGLVFRMAYLSVEHGIKTFKSTFIEEISFSLVPTIFIQFIGYNTAWLLAFKPRIKDLYLVLINNEKAASAIQPKDLNLFIAYLLATYLFSLVAGYLLRKLAERNNWDINFPVFRLYNEWYYTLRGFYYEESGSKFFVLADEVWVDVVLVIGADAYIYRGMINDFILSRDEGLDRIYLSDVKRRKLDHDKETEPTPALQALRNQELVVDYNDENDANMRLTNAFNDTRYYEMPGLLFMIKYAEIRNINFEYIFYDEEPALS